MEIQNLSLKKYIYNIICNEKHKQIIIINLSWSWATC